MENNKPKKRKKSLYRTRELHLMLFPADDLYRTVLLSAHRRPDHGLSGF